MILFLTLFLFFAGFLLLYVGGRKNNDAVEWGGVCLSGIFGGVLLVMGFVLVYMNIGVHAEIEKNKAIYESLVYQYENNFYDNDNDVGKKELIREIQDWNSDLAYYQNVQRDFWIGVFVPNIYDQFEFIELDKREEG